MSRPRDAQLIRWREGATIALLLNLGTWAPFAVLLWPQWRATLYLGPCATVVAFAVAWLIEVRWRRGTSGQPHRIPVQVVETVGERFRISMLGDAGGKVTGPNAKTSRDALRRG